jgi:LmbE family N-acetylglucosaminyl deacetylase
MLKLELSLPKDRPLKVLCLGAHSDDIEIGCGGTILKLLQEHKNVAFYWVVFSANQERKKEAIKSANTLLKPAKEKTVVVKNFRDGFFPYIGAEIKEYFETLKRSFSPDVIFTHYRDDLHQDHRLVSELTWNTFRDHMILEYEIPKYDGDLGTPNVFVHLDEGAIGKKIQHILRSFKSQAENQWFTEDTFKAMLRLRGIESNSPSGYAEGFYSRKTVLL